MAGLGVNLGFGDVAALTSSLLLANGRGADWGEGGGERREGEEQSSGIII